MEVKNKRGIKTGLVRGKKCKKCGADYWHKIKNKNGSLGFRCGVCANKHKRQWKLKHRDRYREYSWKWRRINITLDQYKELEKKQNYCCAICGKRSNKLRVDHCHKTGIIRGLLCTKCNALALNIDTVSKVLDYLKKYDTKG